MKIQWIIGGAVIAVVVWLIVLSQDDRDEITDRISNARQVLAGNNADGERPSKIVREQQRKEQRRQDNTWTAENRAAYPIEYCQAQLEEIAKHERVLEARIHEKSCVLASVKRTIEDNETMEKNLKQFLADAKQAYRASEASNIWPVVLGGYKLSKEKAEDKIIDAAQKLAEIQSGYKTKENQIVQIEKSIQKAREEQKRVVKLRESIQNTISDLKLKHVIEDDNGIKAALDAISDNMGTLGTDYDDPPIESIVQPDPKATREELFRKIMAE